MEVFTAHMASDMGSGLVFQLKPRSAVKKPYIQEWIQIQALAHC